MRPEPGSADGDALSRRAKALIPEAVRHRLQHRRLRHRLDHYPRRVVEHDYGGLHLRVDLTDTLAEGWYDHDWSPLPELALLGRHGLRRGARVFDLGAHQGVVALMLGDAVGPQGQVVAVEPNPHNVAACRSNAVLNAMPWVVTVAAAAGDEEGNVHFNGGLNGAAAEVRPYALGFEATMVTIDGLAARFGPADVVFVDVEGFEARVLAGASSTFASRPDWFVEVHVGCGLEAAGGSVDEVLRHFPPGAYDRFVHTEHQPPVRLEATSAVTLSDRFFLTALAHRDARGSADR